MVYYHGQGWVITFFFALRYTVEKKTPLDSLWKLFEGTEMAKHDGHLSHFTFLLFLMGEGTVQKIEGGMS